MTTRHLEAADCSRLMNSRVLTRSCNSQYGKKSKGKRVEEQKSIGKTNHFTWTENSRRTTARSSWSSDCLASLHREFTTGTCHWFTPQTIDAKTVNKLASLETILEPLNNRSWWSYRPRMLLSKDPNHQSKQRTVLPGDAYEDTVFFIPGWKFSNSKPGCRVSVLHFAVNRYYQWLSDIKLDHLHIYSLWFTRRHCKIGPRVRSILHEKTCKYGEAWGWLDTRLNSKDEASQGLSEGEWTNA